ncbi:MAG: permease prefix domain 1-containing protein [Planctomycetota bacterium]
MFDLSEKIDEWRCALIQRDTWRETDIDELENHLREEIAGLARSGLSEQEAFSVAAHRLGDPQALADEFAKVNPATVFSHRIWWMLRGILIYLVFAYLAGATWRGFVLLSVVGGLRGHYPAVAGMLLSALVLSLTVLLFVRALRLNISGSIFGRSDLGWIGKVFICLGVLLFVVGLHASKLFFFARTARIVGAQDFGKITIVQSIVSNLALPVLFPVVLAVLLLRLRRAGPSVTDG